MRLTSVHRRIAVGVVAGAFGLIVPALPAAAEMPRASGIVHVVTEPAFGQWHVLYEVWYNRDGSGWRMRKTGRSGETNWVADRRGVRVVASGDSVGGPAGTDFISREELVRRGTSNSDYLTRPWVDLAIDPLVRVARGEMKAIGETTINGEAASELVYTDPEHGGSGHYFAAKDDGALLEARTDLGGVVNVETYEVLPVTPATLSKLKVNRENNRHATRHEQAGR